MTDLQSVLHEAVRDAVSDTLADEVRQVVAKETRRALRAHEDELTAIVRAAVVEALAQTFASKEKDQ